MTGCNSHQGQTLLPQQISQLRARPMYPGGIPTHTADNAPVNNTNKSAQINQNRPAATVDAQFMPDLNGQIDIGRHHFTRDKQGNDIFLS